MKLRKHAACSIRMATTLLTLRMVKVLWLAKVTFVAMLLEGDRAIPRLTFHSSSHVLYIRHPQAKLCWYSSLMSDHAF